MRAVAPAHEVEELRARGAGGGLERGGARHRDGRGGQSVPGVGVPGRVGLQVALAQVAVEALAQPVDHRGVGLQPHALPQAIDEHGSHDGALAQPSRLLLDDGGEDERLVGAPKRQGRVARLPGPGEPALHLRVGAPEDLDVRGAGHEAVGVGKEDALERRLVHAQRGADLRVAAPGERRPDVGTRAHLRQPLPEGGPFHEGDLDGEHVAARELVEELQRRERLRHAVGPRLQRARLANRPAEEPEGVGLGQQPLVGELARDTLEARPALHGEVEGRARRLERRQAEPRPPRERGQRHGGDQEREPTRRAHRPPR